MEKLREAAEPLVVRYLHDKAARMKVPINVTLELTSRCNFNCKMCYVHLQDPAVRQRLLSGEQWIAIMDGAVRQGMISALLTGGEALTHPDFRTTTIGRARHPPTP